MGREWQPGEVAMVTDVTGITRPMIRIGHDPAERCWHGAESNGDLRCLVASQDVRPLVVIDPEDREQVERLVRAFWDAQRPDDGGSDDFRYMAAALREFANPKPLEPAEPIGDGALVQCDYDGKRGRAVKLGGSWTFYGESLRDYGAIYDDFDSVQVLSEGVTP